MAIKKLNNTLVKQLFPDAKPYEVRDTEIKGLLVRVQPSGSKTFYIEYSQGKRFRLGDAKSLTVSIARDLARKKKVEAASGKDPIEEKKQKSIVTFSEFFHKKYKNRIKTTSNDPIKAIKRYESICSRVGNWKLEFFTPLNMQKYITDRKNSGVANATINREIANIQTLLKFAYVWGYIKQHPFQGKVQKLKVANEHPRFLDPEEEARLREALKNRDDSKRGERERSNLWRQERHYDQLPEIGLFCDHLTPLVLTAMLTGLRRGELFNLVWADINLKTKLLQVKAQGSKSGKSRTVPLDSENIEVFSEWKKITKYRKPEDFVFPNSKGKRLDNITTSFKNLLKAADITEFRFHDLRHHYASTLMQEGVQPYTVMELMGHSDFKMTQRYAHLAPGNLQEAVKALDEKRKREIKKLTLETG